MKIGTWRASKPRRLMVPSLRALVLVLMPLSRLRASVTVWRSKRCMSRASTEEATWSPKSLVWLEGALISSSPRLKTWLAALAGCEIDNALIEVDGPEIPVFDGSAAPFVFLIECAGTVAQWAPRRAIRVLKSVAVFDGDKRMSLRPSNGFSVEFEIDFESRVIARQTLAIDVDAAVFKAEIARARTFGFAHEVEQLKQAGLARGGSLENAVVIADDRVLNAEGLRYADEFVRHKMLDCIGDLYLAGAPIIGRVQALRSGHNLNHRLLEALFADEDAWSFVDAPAAERYAPQAARHGWATPAAATA